MIYTAIFCGGPHCGFELTLGNADPPRILFLTSPPPVMFSETATKEREDQVAARFLAGIHHTAIAYSQWKQGCIVYELADVCGDRANYLAKWGRKEG